VLHAVGRTDFLQQPSSGSKTHVDALDAFSPLLDPFGDGGKSGKYRCGDNAEYQEREEKLDEGETRLLPTPRQGDVVVAMEGMQVL
jgi:hypothetical protein